MIKCKFELPYDRLYCVSCPCLNKKFGFCTLYYLHAREDNSINPIDRYLMITNLYERPVECPLEITGEEYGTDNIS